eukprot:532943-Amphidinium_carterae.1
MRSRTPGPLMDIVQQSGNGPRSGPGIFQSLTDSVISSALCSGRGTITGLVTVALGLKVHLGRLQ